MSPPFGVPLSRASGCNARHRSLRSARAPATNVGRLKAELAFEQLAPISKFRRLMEAAVIVSAQGARALERTSPAEQSAVLARCQRPTEDPVDDADSP